MRSIFLASLPLLFALGHVHASDSAAAPVLNFADTYHCERAEMPLAALRKGVGGRTEIAFRIQEDGSITDVTVLASAGESREHKMLDAASREQIRSCRYVGPKPKPQPGIHRVSLVWRVQ